MRRAITFEGVRAACGEPGHLVMLTPQGRRLDQPGVMVNDIDLTKKYYDASAEYRLDAINGKLNSGEIVDDPRSKDRQSY